jgi:hypothetical protein
MNMDFVTTPTIQNNDQPAQLTTPTKSSKASTGWLIGGLLFWLLGGMYGAYLSWSCNSNHGFGAFSRLIFSLFAMLGGWGYVLNYLIFKSYTCDPVASLLASPDAAARFLGERKL